MVCLLVAYFQWREAQAEVATLQSQLEALAFALAISLGCEALRGEADALRAALQQAMKLKSEAQIDSFPAMSPGGARAHRVQGPKREGRLLACSPAKCEENELQSSRLEAAPSQIA